MTSRSAAVYGVGGVLLVACLAAANMPQTDETPVRAARAPRSAAPDSLALEVNAQADRLRRLMAQAPTPAMHARNPFAFRAAPSPRVEPSPTVHAAVAADEAPAIAPLPPLTLMGVAEDTTPAGPRRTAVIGGDGDTIYMVVEGDTVGTRYRVTKIGADAVELEDVTTKGFRRLALR